MSLWVLGIFIIGMNGLFGLMCVAQIVYEKNKTKMFYIALAVGIMIAIAHIVFVLSAFQRFGEFSV